MTSPTGAWGGWWPVLPVKPTHHASEETAFRDPKALREMHLEKDVTQTSEGKNQGEWELQEQLGQLKEKEENLEMLSTKQNILYFTCLHFIWLFWKKRTIAWVKIIYSDVAATENQCCFLHMYTCLVT